VVFLDVLGTKGSWKRAPERILKQWEGFNDVVDSLLRNRVKDPRSWMRQTLHLKVQKIAFSDTFILTATSRRHLGEFLVLAAGNLLIPMMMHALDMGIYFRGCISFGTFYTSKRMMIGPAIDEAAEYYTMPEWVGVSTAPSAHIGLNKIADIVRDLNLFIRYDIPLKNGIERNGWALNWPSGDREEGITRMRKMVLNRKLSKSADVGISFKYRNTIDFYRHAIDKTKAWEKLMAGKER